MEYESIAHAQYCQETIAEWEANMIATIFFKYSSKLL